VGSKPSCRGRGRGRRLALLAVPAALMVSGCVHDLGSLGGTSANAEALNESGLIVGNAYKPDGTRHAFRVVLGGELVDLGVGQANDVNDAGVIVGQADGHAVQWEADGTQVGLGAGANSVAHGVNAVGTVVGDAGSEAFVRPAGGPVTMLPHVGEGDVRQSATAVNDHGDIVGYSVALGTGTKAVLWPAPDYQPVVLADPVGAEVFANDINSDGAVVGTSWTSRVSVALVWTAGTHEQVALPLGPDDNFTSAAAINDAGQVVGATEELTDTGSRLRAVRWDPGAAGPTYLGGLGGDRSHALGIDEAGNAVGTARTRETAPGGSSAWHAAYFPHDG
jgi:uncharacterized membrane protein